MTRIEEIRDRLSKATPGPWIANAPQDLAYLLDRVEKLEAVCEAAKEVDASIPATYDENDPMVIRHARALNQLICALTKLKEEVFV